MTAETGIVDDRHALYCGWVIGLGMRHGVDLAPEVVDGNYTNRLRLVFPDNRLGEHPAAVTLVVPYPPDDWTFE